MSSTVSAQTNKLTAERQHELYNMVRQDCGSCHGMTLKGGLGSPLLPDDLKSKSIDFITLTILKGRPNTAMPPWNEIVTRNEARWIAQQLKKGAFK
ncbi:MAG: cytochrome c [Alteromonadaceae bacterium]|nr:cytochrome c [Alteromonadaceae bacterium]